MPMPHTVTALLPMRHNSERVQGKNYRPFGDGRLLFEHSLCSLLETPSVDLVVIDTDSPTILELCEQKYPMVQLIVRPDNLIAANVPMNAIIQHDVSQCKGNYFLQTHSTNPLITSNIFEEAIRTFFANLQIYDSLFSVTSVQSRFWDAMARPINHNRDILLRTQDMPPIFEENSCFYLFDRETMINRNNRIGSRPYLFAIDKIHAADIDEEQDYVIAEQLFKLRTQT